MAEQDIFGPPAGPMNVQPPMRVGPPENEQDYAQRVQNWEKALYEVHRVINTPQARSFLLNLGAGLMRDRAPGQSTLDLMGRSLQSAQAAAERTGEVAFNQANEARRTDVFADRNTIAREDIASRKEESQKDRDLRLGLAKEETTQRERLAGERETGEERRFQLQMRRLDDMLENEALDRASRERIEAAKLNAIKGKARADLAKAGLDARVDIVNALAEEVAAGLHPEGVDFAQLYLDRYRLIDPEGAKEIPASTQEVSRLSQRMTEGLNQGIPREELEAALLSRFSESDVKRIMAGVGKTQPAGPKEQVTTQKKEPRKEAPIQGGLQENIDRLREEEASAQREQEAESRRLSEQETSRRRERAEVINLMNEFRGTNDPIRKEAIRNELEEIFPTITSEGLKKRLIDLLKDF